MSGWLNFLMFLEITIYVFIILLIYRLLSPSLKKVGERLANKLFKTKKK